MALKAITANRLRDGVVVWRGHRGDWVERVEAAAPFDGASLDGALKEALADEARNLVVGVYAFDVDLVGGCPVPLKGRERLRALGPSVRPDVGKQADRRDRAA